MQIVFSIEAARKRGPSGDAPVGLYQITFQLVCGCVNLVCGCVNLTLTTAVEEEDTCHYLATDTYYSSWFVSSYFPAGPCQLAFQLVCINLLYTYNMPKHMPKP